MKTWENKTSYFSEDRRHYNGKYLEFCEVYDEVMEVDLYSLDNKPYEIYVCFGKMYGIVYIKDQDETELIASIKKDLENEYLKNNGEVSNAFINKFVEKYQLTLANDTVFSMNLEDFFD